MSTDLVKIEPENPAALMKRSTDVAGVCKAIVLQTAMKISGRKYVKVEGWEAIATAHGCIASAQDVQRVDPPDGGYRALGVLRRIEDGQRIATAEGFVGNDESAWSKRPVYARRAMAQTRAISRVCRSAFAHVVVLMDAGLSTTPAEEVTEEMGAVDAEPTTHVKSVKPPPRVNPETGEVDETAERVALLGKIDDAYSKMGLNASQRAELWATHCQGMDPETASLESLTALLEALRGMWRTRNK